jgi:hypothetical protein
MEGGREREREREVGRKETKYEERWIEKRGKQPNMRERIRELLLISPRLGERIILIFVAKQTSVIFLFTRNFLTETTFLFNNSERILGCIYVDENWGYFYFLFPWILLELF